MSSQIRRSSRLKAKESSSVDTKNEENDIEKDSSVDLDSLVSKTFEFMVSKLRQKSESVDLSKDDFIAINDKAVEMTALHNTQHQLKLASELLPDQQIPELYLNLDNKLSNLKQPHSKTDELDKLMERSVITADFAKRHTAPPVYVSEKTKRKQIKVARQQSAGPNWFNLPATEMTPEIEQDLKILKLRNVLDRKRHYKKNDSKTLPKYFQVGTVVEGAADFYSSRLSKRDRKSTIVDELLADTEFRRYNKKKYLEIQSSKQSGKKGFYKKKMNRRKPNWARK